MQKRPPFPTRTFIFILEPDSPSSHPLPTYKPYGILPPLDPLRSLLDIQVTRTGVKYSRTMSHVQDTSVVWRHNVQLPAVCSILSATRWSSKPNSLRPEQSRNLQWQIQRENNPKPFTQKSYLIHKYLCIKLRISCCREENQFTYPRKSKTRYYYSRRYSSDSS